MHLVRVLLLSVLCVPWTSCATPMVESRPIATLLPAETPGEAAGVPMHSPELARDIAELVLAEQGIDCRGKETRISFFEGVYTIAFRALPATRDETSYEVDIREEGSRVLEVRRFLPRTSRPVSPR